MVISISGRHSPRPVRMYLQSQRRSLHHESRQESSPKTNGERGALAAREELRQHRAEATLPSRRRPLEPRKMVVQGQPALEITSAPSRGGVQRPAQGGGTASTQGAPSRSATNGSAPPPTVACQAICRHRAVKRREKTTVDIATGISQRRASRSNWLARTSSNAITAASMPGTKLVNNLRWFIKGGTRFSNPPGLPATRRQLLAQTLG